MSEFTLPSTMDQQTLYALARQGAESKLKILLTEIEQIYAHFPDLRPSHQPVGLKTTVKTTKKASGMSEEGRQRIRDAQKARWAKLKMQKAAAMAVTAPEEPATPPKKGKKKTAQDADMVPIV